MRVLPHSPCAGWAPFELEYDAQPGAERKPTKQSEPRIAHDGLATQPVVIQPAAHSESLASRAPARPQEVLAVLVQLLCLAAIYLPDLGHGFLKDDFGWILGSRVQGAREISQLFLRDNGFYRPVVSLSFLANYRMSGLEPFWYGLTNFGLVIGVAAAIGLLALSLRIHWALGVLWACLWSFNPHWVALSRRARRTGNEEPRWVDSGGGDGRTLA